MGLLQAGRAGTVLAPFRGEVGGRGRALAGGIALQRGQCRGIRCGAVGGRGGRAGIGCVSFGGGQLLVGGHHRQHAGHRIGGCRGGGGFRGRRIAGGGSGGIGGRGRRGRGRRFRCCAGILCSRGVAVGGLAGLVCLVGLARLPGWLALLCRLRLGRLDLLRRLLLRLAAGWWSGRGFGCRRRRLVGLALHLARQRLLEVGVRVGQRRAFRRCASVVENLVLDLVGLHGGAWIK